jgi:hypothetical protein
MIPKNVIAAAEAACKDSRARFQARDRSVSPAEGEAYLALVGALKTEGRLDPMADLVIMAASGHVQSAHSPLDGRDLTA